MMRLLPVREESTSRGLKPTFFVALMPGLKPRPISEAKATTSEARARAMAFVAEAAA
jgi:hypothetical protein